MKYNKYINNVTRMKIARMNKQEYTRLDCAERIYNFDKSLFQKFINTLTQEDFITYPSYAEYAVLERKIANHFNILPNQVCISGGSDSCIKDLIHVTCTSGSEILAVKPCFPMYFVYGDCYDANFVGVDYLDFLDDSVGSYLKNVNENTRLAIFTNPGSPYGDFTNIKQISELCTALNKKGVILLVDEAYVDFAPKSCVELLNKHENMLISRTFSKGWGGAGTRVGY